jgi:hypothetical protein
MLTMMWYDQRLIFKYLDPDVANNLSPKEEQRQIWVPKVVFESTKNKLQTVMDERTSTNVENFNISSFEITDETNAEAIKQYSGDENLLVSATFYNSKFHCTFQMHWYPFDLQVCQAVFGMAEDQANFVQLHSKAMEYVGSEDLTLYYLRGTNRCWKNFILTFLLNLIGHSANYLKQFFFEAVISSNVNVMPFSLQCSLA